MKEFGIRENLAVEFSVYIIFEGFAYFRQNHLSLLRRFIRLLVYVFKIIEDFKLSLFADLSVHHVVRYV